MELGLVLVLIGACVACAVAIVMMVVALIELIRDGDWVLLGLIISVVLVIVGTIIYVIRGV